MILGLVLHTKLSEGVSQVLSLFLLLLVLLAELSEGVILGLDVLLVLLAALSEVELGTTLLNGSLQAVWPHKVLANKNILKTLIKKCCRLSNVYPIGELYIVNLQLKMTLLSFDG